MGFFDRFKPPKKIRRFFDDIGQSFQSAASATASNFKNLKREIDEIKERNRVLAFIVPFLAPTLKGLEQSLDNGIFVYDNVLAHTDLKWYDYFTGPNVLLTATYQTQRVNSRLRKTAFDKARDQRERFLASARADLQQETADLAALKTTGEIRLLGDRIKATYVGNSTFVTDDKPQAWRMYEQLYRIRLQSSDEYRRSNLSRFMKPFSQGEALQDAYLSSARHYRAVGF